MSRANRSVREQEMAVQLRREKVKGRALAIELEAMKQRVQRLTHEKLHLENTVTRVSAMVDVVENLEGSDMFEKIENLVLAFESDSHRTPQTENLPRNIPFQGACTSVHYSSSEQTSAMSDAESADLDDEDDDSDSSLDLWGSQVQVVDGPGVGHTSSTSTASQGLATFTPRRLMRDPEAILAQASLNRAIPLPVDSTALTEDEDVIPEPDADLDGEGGEIDENPDLQPPMAYAEWVEAVLKPNMEPLSARRRVLQEYHEQHMAYQRMRRDRFYAQLRAMRPINV